MSCPSYVTCRVVIKLSAASVTVSYFCLNRSVTTVESGRCKYIFLGNRPLVLLLFHVNGKRRFCPLHLVEVLVSVFVSVLAIINIVVIISGDRIVIAEVSLYYDLIRLAWLSAIRSKSILVLGDIARFTNTYMLDYPTCITFPILEKS